MKYPFNKPPVIRRPLGTAADILLHSYTYPVPRTFGGLPPEENVRRMLGVERESAFFYLSFHIPPVLSFLFVEPSFTVRTHKSRLQRRRGIFRN